VVEAAMPPAFSFRPRTSVNLLVGLMLGLTLGLALAFFLDHLDNTISTAAELEQLTSVPVLSLIPSHGRSDTALARVRRKSSSLPADSIDLIAHVDSRTQASEAYRSLRTSILLSNPGRPPRRIVLTSAIPGEGKSATALNLAVVLAQLGRRVVIIDTDLRRPRLHHAFQLSDRVGASTYLSGLERDSSHLIQPTGIEHLYFIASGPIPPNPSELLNSPIFARLGNELLEQGFDHIIYDSPPVLSVSDPVIVAAAADTCIMVVRAGRTPRQSIRTAVERLAQSGGGPLGIVLNHFDVEAGYGRYEYDERYRPGGPDEDVEPPTSEATAGNPAKSVSGRA
jgi:capsular exopolysaccharide synthesis family protein